MSDFCKSGELYGSILCILKIFPNCSNPVEKAIQFVQAEKLFYETALIQAGKDDTKCEFE